MAIGVTTTRALRGAAGTPAKLRQIKRHPELQKYLDASYKKVKDLGKLDPDFGLKTHVPISMFLRSNGTDHMYAGKFDDELHFSGSLIKVAAMFAAFKLRKEASLLMDEVRSGTVVATTPAQFFSKLEARFNPNDAVPRISNATGIQKRPSLPNILSVTSFPGPVTFTSDFRDHLRLMIVPSNNCSAGECLFRLSYPYLNVKLMESGFFDRASLKGIWLCGDYILPPPDCTNQNKKQTFIRIDTVNDCEKATNFCGSAQNTTSKQMARFFLEILLELVDKTSSQEMLALLHEGQHGDPSIRERSFLTRPGTCRVPLLFDVDGVKIGQGPIKTDPDRGTNEVRSEGIIIKWQMPTDAIKKLFHDRNLTGEGAICWQNFPNNKFTDPIAEIINNTVSNFINKVPLTP